MLIGDGNCKVLTMCSPATQAKKKIPKKKRAGRPRKHKKERTEHMSHGWFMLVTPEGRVVTMVHMIDPENNDHVTEALTIAVMEFKKLDALAYDRMCSYAPKSKSKEIFKRVKWWAVDAFHLRLHKETCKYSPRKVPALKRRFKGVNTSVAEQTFSWLRNYARTVNEMKETRGRFLTMLYVKRHNELVEAGNTEHLNPYKAGQDACRTKKRSRSYDYSTPVAKEMMKAMKA